MGQRFVGSLPRGELGLDGHLLVRRVLSEIDWERESGEKGKFIGSLSSILSHTRSLNCF
jgi:hypothetical protein